MLFFLKPLWDDPVIAAQPRPELRGGGSHPTFGRVWRPIHDRPVPSLKKLKAKARKVKAKVAILERQNEADEVRQKTLAALVAAVADLQRHIEQAFAEQAERERAQMLMLIEQANREIAEARRQAREDDDLLLILSV